jgi:hypothetical protein
MRRVWRGTVEGQIPLHGRWTAAVPSVRGSQSPRLPGQRRRSTHAPSQEVQRPRGRGRPLQPGSGRYERQGSLVEESALQKAEQECLADADQRAARREREEVRRNEQDHDLAARVAGVIRELFPGCPPVEVTAIAAHATLRGSGRVGRTAAGKALEEGALTAAVIAAIRHNHTNYDELLMNGSGRPDARDAVRDDVARTLDLWRKPVS